MGFYSLLWVALLYNAYIFIKVLSTMRMALAANANVLDPTATQEMHSRLNALGQRFLLYLLTFLASQFPCALRHIFVVVFGAPETWASPVVWGVLSLAADTLCPLHGFLNGIVYGIAARGICKAGRREGGLEWEGQCCSTARRALRCRRWWDSWRYRQSRSTFHTVDDSVEDGTSHHTTPLISATANTDPVQR